MLEFVVGDAGGFHAGLLLRGANGIARVAAEDAVRLVVKIAKLHQTLLERLHRVAAGTADKAFVVDGRFALLKFEVGLVFLTANICLLYTSC